MAQRPPLVDRLLDNEYIAGLEQYIPTINRDGRFELYVAPTIQLEEQIEGGEINDISIIGLL